jgi:hypothetical protein
VTEDSVDMIISDDNIEPDEVVDWIRKQNFKLIELRQLKMNLDEIFFRLTNSNYDKPSTPISVKKSLGQRSSN